MKSPFKYPDMGRFQPDLSAYSGAVNNPECYYGLPQDITYCSKCVISNQRPNSAVEFKHKADSKKGTIHLDEAGVCDACHVAEQKKAEIDWEARERELVALCDKYRSRNGSYDCVVPGSGGKDSFYASYMLKYKYGMHPLTVTWAPHVYTEWGWRNFERWIHSGFDNYLMTPNGRAHRLLTRLAVENLFHPFQAFILGQKNLAPKMSVLHKIPLVFYGENEAEYGNPKGDMKGATRSTDYFAADDLSEMYLGGVSVPELLADFDMVRSDVDPYLPADPKGLAEVGTTVHYLGYYLKWHPQSCYYFAAEHGGFEASPERTPGTYSKYNSIDDRIDDFHYYCTYIKFGIGRATYDAAQEVRSGDITREEGQMLVRKFDGEFPERFAEEIFQYLSLPEAEFPKASKLFEQPIMDRSYFDALTDRFRSPHIWKHEDGVWKLRRTVFDDL
ncbi:N-acetyl sugar amidotransferase [Aestuariispira insulae]|uniref:N-acetyl sugar amidotransferase n=1 Tax=Aestuariispira insulae TaxID=1461337 RepID=A0A3D9HXG0_9PROT|nr:N-acetyl sugar amidotransferase [Aestuariispira insulae]RED54100.1 N-acetyl sugar amidotransferase [Aestuariispira insulae]